MDQRGNIIFTTKEKKTTTQLHKQNNWWDFRFTPITQTKSRRETKIKISYISCAAASRLFYPSTINKKNPTATTTPPHSTGTMRWDELEEGDFIHNNTNENHQQDHQQDSSYLNFDYISLLSKPKVQFLIFSASFFSIYIYFCSVYVIFTHFN